ncbi:MAG: recombinase A [SAR324 cluster bacterium]|nr:recombinase A [SAR324 cluster bacterium]
MTAATLEQLRSRFSGTALALAPERAAVPFRWTRAALAGRFTELSVREASTALTWAFDLVWDAQREGEPAAWIGDRESTFYPPDVADNGVDVEALAVVRMAEKRDIPRAAERLARSGAFGLIVLDLGSRAVIPAPLQGRLVQQARRHDIAILCLTEKAGRASSLGSLISLRVEAGRRRNGGEGFTCALAVSKDKRYGPGWNHQEVRHGPPGLR